MVRGPSAPLAPSLVAAWLLLAPGARADATAPTTTPTTAAPTTTPTSPAESSDTAAAREAFRLGSTLAKQAQWLDALAAFRRSAALKPHPITTYNVAYCERALGHYARAYERFEASLEPGALPDAQTLPSDLVAQAEAYAAEAERRVARVRVTLTDLDMTIRVDGLPIEPMGPRAASATFLVATDDRERAAPPPVLPASFELWLDPGTHVFIATSPGGERVVESRTLDAGATVTLALAPSRAASTTPGPVSTAASAPPPNAVPARPAVEGRDAGALPRQGPPDRTPAIVAFGAGAAALVASAVFAGLALDDKSSLDSDPRCASKRCPDEPYYDDREARMRTFADLATVGLAGGVVGAAMGTYLWVTATRDASAKSHGPVTSGRVAPWVSVDSVGVSGAF